MIDLSGVHEAVALALRGPDPVEAVRVVCRAVPAALPVDGAAISTIVDRQLRETVCASDPTAAELEELQFSLGEGPCFQAFDTDLPVLAPDLDPDTTAAWPIYGSRLAERSAARAVFVFPVSVGSSRVGTLSTYRTTPGRLDVDALLGAMDLAETAAFVLLGLEDPGDALARMRHEAGSRGHEQVHVAAGMVAVQLGLPVGDAFGRLRGYAFVAGRPVVDVADDVVAHRLRLDRSPCTPEPPSPSS